MKILYTLAIVLGGLASGLTVWEYYKKKNCKCNNVQTETEKTKTEENE